MVVEGSTRHSVVTLLELSSSGALLTAAERPALGATVAVAVTLSGRYLEFELPAVVTWHRGQDFGISFDYLSARQTYGLALAIDVLGTGLEADAPVLLADHRAGRR